MNEYYESKGKYTANLKDTYVKNEDDEAQQERLSVQAGTQDPAQIATINLRASPHRAAKLAAPPNHSQQGDSKTKVMQCQK